MAVLLSIIIPSHNEEKYIGNTLRHVLKQTMQRDKYEIIVSDAHSTDATFKVAKKYADKVLLADTHNAAEGRNYGAKYAKGKILLFLDADTLLGKESLTRIEEFINKGYGGGTFTLLGQESNFVDKLSLKILEIIEILSAYVGIAYTNGSCTFVTREGFDKTHGFNPKIDVGEDNDFIRRVSKFYKTGLIKYYAEISLRRIHRKGWIPLYWLWAKSFFKSLFSREIKNKEYWEDR
ncbi:Glycosyltransferase AglE [Candidatus Tiddalikarchaeum anstoanum]|nr:Glycosyltransferase AglE [Candidatus Tiddalikarchaeum anstoanum]